MAETAPRSGQPGSTDPMSGLGDLALFLGGSENSFIGDLLKLIAKADPMNLYHLGQGFPHVVDAWETWHSMDPTPTADELRARLRADEDEVRRG